MRISSAQPIRRMDENGLDAAFRCEVPNPFETGTNQNSPRYSLRLQKPIRPERRNVVRVQRPSAPRSDWRSYALPSACPTKPEHKSRRPSSPTPFTCAPAPRMRTRSGLRNLVGLREFGGQQTIECIFEMDRAPTSRPLTHARGLPTGRPIRPVARSRWRSRPTGPNGRAGLLPFQPAS